MRQNAIEPGLLRIFRYFTGIAMIYFALIVVYTALQTGQAVAPSQILSYVNFGINLILLGYLSWPWLRRRLGRSYLPVALLLATVIPVLSNLVYFTDSQANLGDTITRSWLLLPILLVPLVLIAWQYRFRYVIAFIVFTTAIELSVLLPFVRPFTSLTVPIFGVPLIRAFAFGTVSQIVARLIDNQRQQRQALMQANRQLAQHAKTLEELATSRERNRLARELHDTLAHTLSGLTVSLEAIKITQVSNPDEVPIMLDHALENTRTGLSETRRALKDLRVKQLADLGLAIALHNLAENAASRAGFQLKVQIPTDLPELDNSTEQCLYRITQEALENIVKHAGAQHVQLELQANNHLLELEIFDDGRGFEQPQGDDNEKLGLRGMYERAAMMAADLRIDSHAGQGTRLNLRLELLDGESLDL
jgi:signal transduction histidine kinase